VRLNPFAVVFVVGVAACTAAADKPAQQNEIEITASDYAFQVPASVPAGVTTFRFRNNGKQRHELNISLLKPGVSIDSLLAAVRRDESVKSLTDGPVGVLFASPGELTEGRLTTELIPGRHYAVICIFRDSAAAPRHYDMGMYAIVRVADRPPSAVATGIPTDTIIGTDYAFQYPRTVTPGRRRFAFRNEGKMRHELSIALLRPGVTLQKVQETEKAGGDVDALFEKDFGLVHARGGESPLGQLEIEMLPGREYTLACFFQDDPKAPEHYTLGMYGSIRVSGKATT
jgi:plastocyanin